MNIEINHTIRVSLGLGRRRKKETEPERHPSAKIRAQICREIICRGEIIV